MCKAKYQTTSDIMLLPAAVLLADMREAREKHITLHGVDGDVLAAFIRFLYTCHCSIAPDKLVGLCAMADQYDVTLLQQLCMDAIRMHAANHRYKQGPATHSMLPA
jgi:hypothetical protein